MSMIYQNRVFALVLCAMFFLRFLFGRSVRCKGFNFLVCRGVLACRENGAAFRGKFTSAVSRSVRPSEASVLIATHRRGTIHFLKALWPHWVRA